MDVSKRAEESIRVSSWKERLRALSMGRRNGRSVLSEGPPLLPSFFVIGPPRTGTTWLHEVLKDRVLLPTPTKETRFFDTHFHRGVEWYRSHFPRPRAGHKVGEIAPTYFASRVARERIAEVAPGAKVICAFRDPVERVLSLYRLKSAYGLIRWDFEEAILHDPELIESGRYATNLKAWRLALGGERVLATLYDDLRDQPQRYVDRLVDFIGIPRFELTPTESTRVNASEAMTHPRSYHRTRRAAAAADWFKARRFDRLVARVKRSPLQRFFLGGGRPFQDLSEDFARKLYEMFQPEVEELENLLDRDLSAWKPLRSSGS